MIDTIQLPTVSLERERSEIHLEFQEQCYFKPMPTVPYVYGIIDLKKRNDFKGEAMLATKQII